MPAHQCLVVCQLCNSPPYKSWSYTKMVDHLKTYHQTQDDDDAERLATDWLTDASRGRPRYPIEVFRRFLGKDAAEGLAEALGFILTSPDRELCGVDEVTGRVRQRRAAPMEELSGDGIVDSTYFEDNKRIVKIVIDDDRRLNGAIEDESTQTNLSHINPVSQPARKADFPSTVESQCDAVFAPRIVTVRTTSGASGGTYTEEQPSSSRHEDLSFETIVPPGWNLSRIDAAYNAWSKDIALKSQIAMGGSMRRLWYWRLCPLCGVPRYTLSSSNNQMCDHCGKKDYYLQLHVRLGWRPIPPSLWAWVRSPFRNDRKVLTELTSLLRDVGVIAVKEDGVARLGGDGQPSPWKKKKLEEKTRPFNFDELFPESVTSKGQRAYFLCPCCDNVNVNVMNHLQYCKPLHETKAETRDLVKGLLEERRMVIPSSRLRNLMNLTKERRDLRPAVAAVLCCIGATVLDGTVISPWEFVTRA